MILKKVWMNLAKWLEHLTANAKVERVLCSVPASFVTAKKSCNLLSFLFINMELIVCFQSGMFCSDKKNSLGNSHHWFVVYYIYFMIIL
jgi:hypothetical protein